MSNKIYSDNALSYEGWVGIISRIFNGRKDLGTLLHLWVVHSQESMESDPDKLLT